MKKKILIGILIVFIAIQFIRPEKNSGQADTPTDITHYVNVPPDVKNILKRSCYDCHSNHTEDFWYNEIMPFGWWLKHHINEGKADLNFSDFSKYDKKTLDKKLKKTEREILKRDMPLPSYTIIHPELSDEEIKLLVTWINTEREKLK